MWISWLCRMKWSKKKKQLKRLHFLYSTMETEQKEETQTVYVGLKSFNAIGDPLDSDILDAIVEQFEVKPSDVRFRIKWEILCYN